MLRQYDSSYIIQYSDIIAKQVYALVAKTSGKHTYEGAWLANFYMFSSSNHRGVAKCIHVRIGGGEKLERLTASWPQCALWKCLYANSMKCVDDNIQRVHYDNLLCFQNLHM